MYVCIYVCIYTNSTLTLPLQDSVFELVNKHTTHTWVEERVVLRHYRVCCRLIRAVLGNLRLKGLRAQVVKAEKRADLIMQTVPTDTRRVLCT